MRKARLIAWLIIRMLILVFALAYAYRDNYPAATFHLVLYLVARITQEAA